ncbi:MAG: MBOAT family protein [Desulfovibrio sp.]|nr:MBOAT family protein [Desulfovibrio sp.]
MEFNSLIFIVFACIFFCCYPLVKKNNNLRYIYIIIASSIFYGFWDWRYLFLIVFTGTIDYVASLVIAQNPRIKKICLYISMACNLSILFSFKYLLWLLGYVNTFLQSPLFSSLSLSLSPSPPPPPEFFKVLPIGISFYTFQSMSYTIDVYRGNIRPVRNYFLYFCYLSMFPQLVAGPIVRAKDVIHQIRYPDKLTGARLYGGVAYIATGFFKKTVIADSLAPFVNQAFTEQPLAPDAFYWWLVVVAFSIQIYCDFSGYSDIAIGLARWMGIDYKDNFHFPYHSSSPSDFWKRWHISLSSWFRDYVYIPLGGSRVSPLKVHRNLWTTMLLSGFWHGASLHFVAWGGYHAFLLSIQRIFNKKIFIPNFVKIILTFFLILLGWIFFRSQSVPQAFSIFAILFSPHTYHLQSLFNSPNEMHIIIYLFLIFNFLMLSRRIQSIKVKYEPYILGILIAITIFYRGQGNEFIYFQF